MAHFAKLNEENIVMAVHVLSNEVLIVNGNEDEIAGIIFLEKLHNHKNWKQTSYNATFRKNYAGIGYFYDETRDAFIPPKPYESWILDEEKCIYIPPIPKPVEGNYVWNQNLNKWIEVDL